MLGALAASAPRPCGGRWAGSGPFRLDDAEAAQAELAERLRRLHDHGTITLPDPDGQEAILV